MARNLKYSIQRKQPERQMVGPAEWNDCKFHSQGGNPMKKSRKTKDRKASQTAYTKILQSLRSSLTSEYSKVLRRETRGIILGYD
jgi:hypothetical protein